MNEFIVVLVEIFDMQIICGMLFLNNLHNFFTLKGPNKTLTAYYLSSYIGNENR